MRTHDSALLFKASPMSRTDSPRAWFQPAGIAAARSTWQHPSRQPPIAPARATLPPRSRAGPPISKRNPRPVYDASPEVREVCASSKYDCMANEVSNHPREL